MKYYFLYTIIFFHFTLIAQDNLVPNFSFENNSACPTGPDQLANTTDWYSCNAESPDYFNSCQLVPFSYGIPFTLNGYQQARTGQAFAGIHVFGETPSPRREYLQVKLNDVLKTDTDYKVTFYVNLANNSSVSITQLGAYFSTNAVSDTGSLPLPFTPQILSPAGNYLTDTASWIQISGTYTASGGEQFITIGNFKDDNTTDTLQLTNAPILSYYFIDDISVTQFDSSPEAPNVFTPNEDGMNDDWVIRNLPKNSQIKIYDRWGVIVGGVENPEGIQGTFKWDGRTSSGERCKNGVYYYMVTTTDTDATDTVQEGIIHLIR
ncbi:MAG TPA: gliding motility-associated C-terminal domain-containing protein [Bacteroidia bacterium]|nr:gliding motility-associated C-terminal domain-containing protein [Bacteroidia bacterium]